MKFVQTPADVLPTMKLLFPKLNNTWLKWHRDFFIPPNQDTYHEIVQTNIFNCRSLNLYMWTPPALNFTLHLFVQSCLYLLSEVWFVPRSLNPPCCVHAVASMQSPMVEKLVRALLIAVSGFTTGATQIPSYYKYPKLLLEC